MPGYYIPGLTRRILKGAEFRGVSTIQGLLNIISKRAKSDTAAADVFYGIIGILEPMGCGMPHCKAFGGVGAFCMCNLGRVPANCKEYRQYQHRKRVRGAKKAAKEV